MASDTITKAVQNYADFDNGVLFYKFCSDYDHLSPEGYCLDLNGEINRDNIRNKLIQARRMYGFMSVAEQADVQIPSGNIRQLGVTGVLTATRELANIDMIIGNEFSMDGLDYRFSVDAASAGSEMIQQELSQFEEALRQYRMALDVVIYAFNVDLGGTSAVRIGDYFGPDEFELFGIASERVVLTMGEVAMRYRQLGQIDRARRCMRTPQPASTSRSWPWPSLHPRTT